jgi:glutamyl-tRNA reductase
MAPATHDIDRLSVRFATFRDRHADERARIAANLAATGGEETVLLDTCHRVELVAVNRGEEPMDGTSIVRGLAAARRVFEVAAGFDSAVVAEEQLLGQVRSAYEAALATGSTGPVLNHLFRRALRFGRRVRTHARPGSDRSLADPGFAWLAERIPAGARVAIAGTGEMATLLARRLAGADHPLTIISGSPERGSRFVEALSGSGHRLWVGAPEASVLRHVEAIVLALRSRAPVLTRAQLGARHRPWVLDMSSPGAVEPGIAEELGERLLTIDALGATPGAVPVLAEAVERRLRVELDEEVEQFARWLDERRGADAVSVLHREADALRRRHLDRLRVRARLDPDQLAVVEAAAAAMLGEMLHGPTVQIRRGGEDAQVVRRLFGIDR